MEAGTAAPWTSGSQAFTAVSFLVVPSLSSASVGFRMKAFLVIVCFFDNL